MIVYTEGREVDDVMEAPLTSAVVVYLLTYCQCDSNVTLIFVDGACQGSKRTTAGQGAGSTVLVKIEKGHLQHLSYDFAKQDELPLPVYNCELPVVQDEREFLVRSGLCCTVRHIVSACYGVQSSRGADSSLIDLLGFRAGSLKACAEVSGWTKLCEVELPSTIASLIDQFRCDVGPDSLELPVDIMKLELHLEKPPPLHNDDKKKRQILKDVQQTMSQVMECCESDQDVVAQDFFKTRETTLPHGNMYFRVLNPQEMKQRKFTNSENNVVCKFGCTEDKLVKWCAKCNDREKLRQKEIQKQRNEARTVKQKASNSVAKLTADGECIKNVLVDRHTQNGNVDRTGDRSSSEISSVEELLKYVDTLTIHDVVYEHKYAEGIQFTVADVMLFVYFYHLMESMQFSSGCLLQQLPFIQNWLKHIVSLPRICDAAAQCGFNMESVNSCLRGDEGYQGNTMFSIPEVALDVEEENNDITRRSRGKHKALKREIARVLGHIQGNSIDPVIGKHPRWPEVHVDWQNVPLAANPKKELPEKRVARKCEQLENLATAVQAIAKPGDVIVDFCSGAGHLGIILAYLLPDCKVYLIENKEESLLRATARIKELHLSNITMYKCNLDYFHGHFDIGVCLHACGVATDMVLQQCLDRKASFVICPCCYGSIQTTHLITYPRSEQYREAGLKDKDVIILGHAADQTEDNIQLYEQGRHCMNLVDTDRAQLAREMGYSVTLCSLHPLSCTPKNNLLIGTAPS